MGKLYYEILNLLVLVLTLILTTAGCNNPVDIKEVISKADAGEDQETYVGSFAVLDPSKSKIVTEIIELVEWIQDSGNPAEVNAYGLSIQEATIVGFVREGIYKFTLRISCKSGNVYTDDVTIKVNPRQVGSIEDVNLEIQIRYCLKFKEGKLDATSLLMLDTLTNYNLSLKNKIKNLHGIENCINLNYLTLANESITDLAPLSNLTKLEFLDLNQNYTIEDISPLFSLTNLTKLILYSNPISDISGLGNLTKLKELNLMGTLISEINSLSGLVSLEILTLDCSGTGVSINSIEPLKNLIKLKDLFLTAAGIEDISPLKNLVELEYLNLSFNNLSNISAIAKMKKLTRLYIAFNRIENLDGIKDLENLDFLDAMNNNIKDISELEYLQKIHLIGLSSNKIEDILPLVKNNNLGEGVHLFLYDNPLNEKTLNEYIPALIARGVKVNW